jgi:hypothetical protein
MPLPHVQFLELVCWSLLEARSELLPLDRLEDAMSSHPAFLSYISRHALQDSYVLPGGQISLPDSLLAKLERSGWGRWLDDDTVNSIAWTLYYACADANFAAKDRMHLWDTMYVETAASRLASNNTAFFAHHGSLMVLPCSVGIAFVGGNHYVAFKANVMGSDCVIVEVLDSMCTQAAKLQGDYRDGVFTMPKHWEYVAEPLKAVTALAGAAAVSKGTSKAGGPVSVTFVQRAMCQQADGWTCGRWAVANLAMLMAEAAGSRIKCADVLTAANYPLVHKEVLRLIAIIVCTIP